MDPDGTATSFQGTLIHLNQLQELILCDLPEAVTSLILSAVSTPQCARYVIINSRGSKELLTPLVSCADKRIKAWNTASHLHVKLDHQQIGAFDSVTLELSRSSTQEGSFLEMELAGDDYYEEVLEWLAGIAGSKPIVLTLEGNSGLPLQKLPTITSLTMIGNWLDVFHLEPFDIFTCITSQKMNQKESSVSWNCPKLEAISFVDCHYSDVGKLVRVAESRSQVGILAAKEKTAGKFRFIQGSSQGSPQKPTPVMVHAPLPFRQFWIRDSSMDEDTFHELKRVLGDCDVRWECEKE